MKKSVVKTDMNLLTELRECIKSRFFLIGVVAAIFTWILDSFIDYFFLQRGTFYQLLIHPDTHDAFMRSYIAIIIIMMSFITCVLINRSKHVIESLQVSKKLFHTIYDYSPNALVMANKQGEITLMNNGAISMFGYKEHELIGKNIETLIPTRFQNPHIRHRQGYMNESSPRAMGTGRDLCALRKDGSEFPIEIGLSSVTSNSEHMVLSTIIDITERKQVEYALVEKEEKIRQLVEDANVLSWEADIKTVRFTYMSPQAKEITGYSPEQWCQPDFWLNHLHPEDKDWAVRFCKESVLELKDRTFEYRFIKIDGSIIWFYDNVKIIYDNHGTPTQLRGVMIDVTKRKQAEDKLSFQASHDALTGLVNRHEFERRAERLLANKHQDKEGHAFCYMDLDQFKVVNDTCGHTSGDEMLRQLSSELKNVVRHRDTLARLGGDEFGVLMEHCSLDDAHRVATAIQNAIHDYQFIWEGHSFRVGVSMGLVPITETTNNLTQLLKDADAACYMAKDKGRNRIHVYRTEDTEIAQRHGEMQWVTRINQAIDENRFCLYAQSIMPLDGSKSKHYELLIRMVDEKGEVIPPGAFLPAAERYNLISNIDRWVIKKAFVLLEDNPDFLEQVNNCSINLSGQSLADMDFQKFVIKELMNSNIKPEKICFEITETAAISNLSSAKLFITKMKVLGCRFALDDFGSGLSSFAYLKNMEVDYLKIDGMFVKDIVDDPIDHAMVKSINEIGQVMKMKTIAEFVENEMVKGMLKEIGVNYAQGFGIDKPQPLDEILSRSNNVAHIRKQKKVEVDS
jgi:diguanylate cyclase (GGDEF)-like protein/PAS domain S-box-containing protein